MGTTSNQFVVEKLTLGDNNCFRRSTLIDWNAFSIREDDQWTRDFALGQMLFQYNGGGAIKMFVLRSRTSTDNKTKKSTLTYSLFFNIADIQPAPGQTQLQQTGLFPWRWKIWNATRPIGVAGRGMCFLCALGASCWEMQFALRKRVSRAGHLIICAFGARSGVYMLRGSSRWLRGSILRHGLSHCPFSSTPTNSIFCRIPIQAKVVNFPISTASDWILCDKTLRICDREARGWLPGRKHGRKEVDAPRASHYFGMRLSPLRLTTAL